MRYPAFIPIVPRGAPIRCGRYEFLTGEDRKSICDPGDAAVVAAARLAAVNSAYSARLPRHEARSMQIGPAGSSLGATQGLERRRQYTQYETVQRRSRGAWIRDISIAGRSRHAGAGPPASPRSDPDGHSAS